MTRVRVLLVRHGEAVDVSLVGVDGERWLTSRGRSTTQAVGRQLKSFGLSFTRVIASPLVRAIQTAELLAAAGNTPVELVVESNAAFALGQPVHRMAVVLDECTDEDLVVLVGHEPSMHKLAAHLLGTSNFPGFQTSGSCLIEKQETRGSFKWYMNPKTLECIDTLDGIFE